MWVAEIVFVEINQVQPQPVLHLTLAEIAQRRLPLPILGQIFRYVPGQKTMPASPQFMTRCATLIPDPAMFVLSLTSVT